jgi:hypothetical protein
MLDFAFGVYENIINEDHYELVQFIHENGVIRYMK